MHLKQLFTAALLFTVADGAGASGMKGPVHSQSSFSYACPGGLSGQIQVEKNREPKLELTMRAWVNGAQIDQDPKLQAALAGKNIQYVEPICEGEITLLVFWVWSLTLHKESLINVFIDRAGKVTVKP